MRPNLVKVCKVSNVRKLAKIGKLKKGGEFFLGESAVVMFFIMFDGDA